MNAIGNDNYKPGLKPPEPMKHGSGWLSSNIAQLMVFLNGLILTITAFATLSVFIDEIVQEGLDKVREEVETHILSSYNEAERSLNGLSILVSASDKNLTNKIQKYMALENSGAESLKEIYWLGKNNSNQKIRSLHGNGEFLKSLNSNHAFEDFVQLQTMAEAKDFYLSTFLDHANPQIVNDDYNIYSRNLILVEPIQSEGKIEGYIVGVTDINQMIGGEWFSVRSSLQNLQITDAHNDVSVYSYHSGSQARTNRLHYTNLLAIKMADNVFNVKLDLAVNSREAFLQKIPLLMLLFGVTLTLIGTLYVRNNQSQSRKLSDMNKELAHKNFELGQEVGERERLNQVIRKSARENRSIINSVSDIIFELSADGKILFLNDAWNNVTGFENERSIGRNLFDLIYAQDQEEQLQNFKMLVRGKKKSYRVFTQLRSVDGSFRAIELAMSMVRQDDSKDLRVVGTATDVEERRRAERALSLAEKKYRAIVENAASGIYQVTPEGQFLSANPAMAKILGYNSPEEVLRDVDKGQEKIYVDIQAHQKFLNGLAALDVNENIETQISRKDGSIIWVSENVRPVRDDNGVLLFYEGSMEDIDQRKKAEIALMDAKIESDLANRAKSEFLANMSHELRTPLNAVIGFSEIIKNETFGKLPNKEYKEYADDIHNSGNRLLRVINEILDVSKIEAGERTLNEMVVNVKETVDSCLELMSAKLKSCGMRVENKITNGDLGFVGEPQAVKQMLLNLMSNAVKFSAENSFMMLDAEIDSRGRLRLSVTDTGAGMDDAELEKALSPFGQLETDHNRTKSGTGLGLTLVKSLVNLHGGELEIVSQKNIGTTATLIFPTKRVAQTNKQVKENGYSNAREDLPHQMIDDSKET